MVKVDLGKFSKSGLPFKYNFPENKPTHIRNTVFIDKQGSGKTNLLMSLLFEMFRMYKEKEGKYGALPIVFSPFFEWVDLKLPSLEKNLNPLLEAEGIESTQYTFQMAEPPDDNETEIIAFDFNDLSIEDIGSFANIGGFSDLGKIEKLVNILTKGGTVGKKDNSKILLPNPNYTIEDFLELVEANSGVGDTLYYIFSKLNRSGFFNINKYKPFCWFEAIEKRKPIIINFGDISDPAIYQAVAGYMLRKLDELSNEYYKAYQKDNRELTLNPREKFLLKYFRISLFFEEAHHFFPATISGTLSSFPAIYYYIKLSQKVGRRRGFKYFFCITQKVKFLYFGIRTEVDNVFLGWKLGTDDKRYLLETYKELDEDTLNFMIRLPPFSFCLFDPKRFEAKLSFADKFTAYRSPCGMPK